MIDRANQLSLSEKYIPVLSGLAILFGLYLTSLHSYLLFHSLAELFSVAVAWSVFMLAWNSRRYLDSGYLLLISIAFLFVGALDLLHTLAYKGMGVFKEYDANLPTQLWIAARYLQSISLLFASLLTGRNLNYRFLFIGYGAATSALLLSIFYWHIFPDCFIEGMGLTPFKIFSEYVISLIFLISMALFGLKRKHLDSAVLRLLIFSIITSVGAEIAFTQYVSVYGLSNLLGHFLKIISYYFIYRAIVVTGLVRPLALVFKDLKQSEEALRESETRYRSLVEFSPEAIAVHSEGRYVYINPAGIKLFGAANADEVVGKRVLDLVHPDYRELVRERIQQVEQGLQTPARESKIIRLDGRPVDIEAKATLIAFMGKLAVQVVMTDITERKQMEEERRKLLAQLDQRLREIENGRQDLEKANRLLLSQADELKKHRDHLEELVAERTAELMKLNEELGAEIAERKRVEEAVIEQSRTLETFFRHTITPLVFLDRDFNFIQVNEAYARACQKDVSEFPGHNHFAFYPHEENEAIFRRVVETKVPYQATSKPFVFPDHPEWGVTYWDWTLVPILDAKGEVDFLVFSLIDVTERKRSEEKLSLFKNLINQSSDAIFVVDPDTAGLIDINDAALLALGYGRDELLGMKVTDIALGQPDMARWKEHVEQLKERGHLLLEDMVRRRDGSTFPVEVSVKYAAHQQRDYLLAIVRDVTVRKETENRIAASNALLKLFSQSFTRKEYLDAVVDLVRTWSGCRCVGIRVMDEDSGIPYEAYTGFSSEFWELENWLSAERDECVCIRVIKERPDNHELPVITSDGSFHCNDTVAFIGKLKEEQKARYRGTCIKTGFLSVAVVPIRYRNKMIGAIHLADEREGKVPQKTVEFIELVSPLVGEAIYRYSMEDELRKNYEALKKSEKSLSEAQRIASLGNWEWDLETNELHWSDEVYRIFGLDPAQFGETYVAFLNYVHSDDREFVKSAIMQALHEKKPYSIEHRIVLEDGTVRIVHEQGRVNYNDLGEPVRMVGTVQDITERKLIEEKLRSSREQLRNLSAHLHSLRERERTNIAREIHDELGQALTALKMDVSWLGNKYRDHEAIAEKTKTMIDIIDSTIQTVKRISSELRPVVLDDLGLTAAIEWQVEEFRKRTGIECEVRFDPEDITMDRDRSTTVFRIFQEALTNVIRHAEATRVSVSLEARDDKIILRVKDNGKGITEKEISDPRSFGLMGIRERVHYFGGEVKIRGALDKGTSVEITIPMEGG